MRKAPWSSILVIVNYCGTRVLLYAKMLKETENEQTRLFCQIFVKVAFRLRKPGPPGLPPGYANDFEIRLQP